MIRISDHTDVTEDEIRAEADIRSLAEMLVSRKCRFFEYRAAADKHIKSREDAMMLLDALDDAAGTIMKDQGTDAAAAERMAVTIEKAETARADIARDMNYSRALRRLYLELR
jgi:hypothetical protein